MAHITEDAPRSRWRSVFARKSPEEKESSDGDARPEKWSMGILNHPETIAVPGSVLLLAQERNEPLGLRNAPARTSASSLPTGIVTTHAKPEKESVKKTSNGKFILDPQPEESANDPLNWPTWRRDAALLSLGLYCMVGGGITPILAAGFGDVAADYSIDISEVSLTTGLYMMGLGIGSVIFSPTAILYGKRPVYLFSAVLFIASAVWCALSPNFVSLILARIFQGIAVSPVECLPSATIAEIFFLHERAYRIGIYTLLLLGGKNLVPLVSAAIMQRLGWRWAFWVVAMVVAFCGILLFLFVPETFWDRSPVPRKSRRSLSRPNLFRVLSSRRDAPPAVVPPNGEEAHLTPRDPASLTETQQPQRALPEHQKAVHVGFSDEPESAREQGQDMPMGTSSLADAGSTVPDRPHDEPRNTHIDTSSAVKHTESPLPGLTIPDRTPDSASPIPQLTQHNSSTSAGYMSPNGTNNPMDIASDGDSERYSLSITSGRPNGFGYTRALRDQPARSFVQQLKPFHGRLHRDKWHKVAVRPLILLSYPAVLWSSVVYACSIGWLIVISESVAVIYRERTSYNFNAFQTGLVYISPFIGGILGTAVAGRVSDVIVKAMARRNGGLYEPEFRLVMVVPVAITTVVGLMGFGWSAQVHDAWIVPTVFFGIVSFGCSVGSTTSITFCVDSYRQYAGEALVTLNFVKNIFHGLVFSLFVTSWLTHDGPKTVYIWIGVIQLILLVSTVPLYIYGKRARMWTVRKNFMEKF